MTAWHQRLAAVGWFFVHLDDVLSDMSVLHGVDDLDQIPASVFVPRMLRLPIYQGAVRYAAQAEAAAETDTAVPQPSAAEVREAAPVASADRMAALNRTAEYGPLNGSVGVFDFG